MNKLINPSIIQKRSLEEISESLKSIQALNLKILTVDEVLDQLIKSFNGVIAITNTLDARVDVQLKRRGLFRARKNFGDKFFEHTSELWCLPSKYKKKATMGRCNRVGEVILYCALNEETAIHEVCPNSGDFVTLSRLAHFQQHQKKEIRFKMLGVVDEEKSMDEGTPSEMKKPYPGYQSIFSNPNDVEKVNLIHKFINNTYSEVVSNQEQYKYKLTNAITEYFMKDPLASFEDQLDAIMYSSVKAKDELFNVAIDPLKAEQHMGITDGWVYRIVDNNDPNTWVIVKSFKANEDGKLVYD